MFIGQHVVNDGQKNGKPTKMKSRILKIQFHIIHIEMSERALENSAFPALTKLYFGKRKVLLTGNTADTQAMNKCNGNQYTWMYPFTAGNFLFLFFGVYIEISISTSSLAYTLA